MMTPMRIPPRAFQLSALASALLLTAFGALSKTPTSQVAGPPVATPSTPIAIRLISGQQYENIVRDVFGVEFGSRRFAPVRRADGLVAVGSGTAVVTSGALDVFESTGREIAAEVVAPENRGALISCKPKNTSLPDDVCAATFFSRVGRALLRRSMTEVELASYVDIANKSAANEKSFYAGIESALSVLLVDPEFLYFVTSAEADPEHAGQYRLDGRSKATRLSLLVWNSAPDEALLRAGESGELHTLEGVNRQLERLSTSSKLEYGVRAFFDDMLIFEKFDNLVKDSTIYPVYTLKVRDDAREQALRTIVDHIVLRQGDYRDLFTTRRTFLTTDLAAIYGIALPSAGAYDWVPYEFPEGDTRAGLLTQIAFLSVNSHPGRTSPTNRGRALREVFMCQKVPDPPANVDFSIIEDPNAHFATARERLHAHNSEPTCAGCHKITDPIGLALETFDGAGQFRTHEGAALIDTTGELDGKQYQDASGLAVAVRNNRALISCLTSRLYSYGLARSVTKLDRPKLQQIESKFAAEGFKFTSLLVSLATSDAFFRLSDEDSARLAKEKSGADDGSAVGSKAAMVERRAQ